MPEGRHPLHTAGPLWLESRLVWTGPRQHGHQPACVYLEAILSPQQLSGSLSRPEQQLHHAHQKAAPPSPGDPQGSLDHCMYACTYMHFRPTVDRSAAFIVEEGRWEELTYPIEACVTGLGDLENGVLGTTCL